MDRFKRPGSRQYEVIGQTGPDVADVIATITADYIHFEPEFVTFWTGGQAEEKTLTATVRVDAMIRGIKEVPLNEENLKRWMDYQSSLISDFNKSHYEYFINPLTGETMRQYKDRKDRPIPPLHEQKPCWNKSTSHGVHLWGPEDNYCPGLTA